MSTRSLAQVLALLAVGLAAWTLVSGRRARRSRRAAEEVLERRLDLALEAGGMGTWIFDLVTQRLVWDPRVSLLYGTDEPASVEAWIDLVHPADREEVRAAIDRGMVDGPRFQVVHRRMRGDGEERWLELRGEPVHDGRGALLGTAGVVVDVTEERRAAHELAESRSALEQILDVAPGFVVEERPEEVAARICEAGVTVFGCDACALWALEDGFLRSDVVHPPELTPHLGLRVSAADLPLLHQQLQGRAPAFVSASHPDDPHLQPLMERAGMRSGVLVPLGGADGDVQRSLTMWWHDDVDPPGLGQLAVIRRFADQVALALEQARTRAARDEVDALSESLQAGLLPSPVVRDPGVRVVARYRPGEERILLGGDFYDVVERPTGEVAFVVGDVTGHGPGPAAIGAAMRAAWRALVFTDPDPAAWLRGLAASLASYDAGPELLVTAFTGSIAPTRDWAMVAGAGHPAPMLLSGTVRPLDLPPGLTLGAGDPGDAITSTKIALPQPWRLLLYTDGVIEIRTGRRSSDRLGQDGLAAWLEEHAPCLDDDALLDALLDHLQRTNRGAVSDDVATVLITVS